MSTERIRVARIITRINVGGPAIQAMLLTQRLDPERYETFLVCGKPGPREGDMLELRGDGAVRPIFIPALGRGISPLDDLGAFLELLRVLRRLRPHVVHTHLAKAGLLGRIAARLAGVPVVVHTFHGNVLRGYFGGVTSRVFLLLERFAARLSTRIVAISPRVADELRMLGVADERRLVVIPLGLDLQPFLDVPRGRIRAELGLMDTDQLVVIVARLVPIKGIDVFLDAAAIIARSELRAHFVVVGDGELHDALVARTEALGLERRVHFLGWRADLPAVYGDADVVVLSSHNEGTPVSLIEALAAARAVVATSVGGVPDIVRPGCGALVHDSDAEAMAREITALLHDAESRTRLGRAGRAAVYPSYDAQSLVRRIDDLYRELVANIR